MSELSVCKVNEDDFVHYTSYDARITLRPMTDAKTICGKTIRSVPHEWTRISYSDRLNGVENPSDSLDEDAWGNKIKTCPECERLWQKELRRRDEELADGILCLY